MTMDESASVTDDHEPAPAPRRVGRPRNETVRPRVLDATVRLLLECDAFEDVTIGAVVVLSGVSRAAIYRRWPTREALLADALDTVRTDYSIDLSLPTAAALEVALVGDDAHPDDIHMRLIRRRLILALESPAIQREYWTSHVSRRRAPLVQLLERSQQAGEIRADVDLDVVVDLLAGVGYYQLVVRGEPFGPDMLDRIKVATRLVWQGIATTQV